MTRQITKRRCENTGARGYADSNTCTARTNVTVARCHASSGAEVASGRDRRRNMAQNATAAVTGQMTDGEITLTPGVLPIYQSGAGMSRASSPRPDASRALTHGWERRRRACHRAAVRRRVDSRRGGRARACGYARGCAREAAAGFRW